MFETAKPPHEKILERLRLRAMDSSFSSNLCCRTVGGKRLPSTTPFLGRKYTGGRAVGHEGR